MDSIFTARRRKVVLDKAVRQYIETQGVIPADTFSEMLQYGVEMTEVAEAAARTLIASEDTEQEEQLALPLGLPGIDPGFGPVEGDGFVTVHGLLDPDFDHR